MSSPGTIYSNTVYYMRQHAAALARLYEQASSGARVSRASDDPSDAFGILRLRGQLQSLTTYAKNLGRVDHNLTMAETSLGQISENMETVVARLSQAMSGTYDQTARTAIAEEINSLLEQCLSLANTKSLGQYLMGGAKTDTAPLQAQRDGDGNLTAVEYGGSLDPLPVAVAPGVVYPALLVGRDVFWADSRQPPIFYGDTGARSGSGTSTVRGELALTVTHDQTTSAGGSGIAAGTGSPGSDTIFGQHVLTIAVNGPTQTLSLDGGAAVQFQGTETNLRLTGPDGDAVYVDTTGWAGFTGDVNVTATGKLTIDGGASTADLTSFTDNVAVTHSQTGGVLYVDATVLSRTGDESVSVPGTHDLFGMVIHIRDVLSNAPGRTEHEMQDILSRAVEQLDEATGVLRQATTAVGGQLQALEMLDASLSSLSTAAQNQQAMLSNVDITEVTAELARTQTLYEMTLAVAGRLIDLSLLDYI